MNYLPYLLILSFFHPLSFSLLAVACGMEHYMVLYADGRVIVWGENSFSQLGIGREEGTSPLLCIVGGNFLGKLKPNIDSKYVVEYYADKKIAAISCGGYQSMVLCENGELHLAGANFHGQLGTAFASLVVFLMTNG
jgi:NIMA (never in mitosis gene a)-related kinase/E3 ubiquitin-protein ligase HERC4